MAKARFWTIFTTLAALACVGLWFYPQLQQRLGLPGLETGRSANAEPVPDPAPTVVEAVPVQVETVLDRMQAVGTLLPDEAVTVAPEVAGRIERIAFREGQKVAAGDVLVELDTAIMRAELAKSRSDLTLARANHQRSVTLAREGMAALRARDEALAALQTAEAAVALAEARLQKMTIRAPLSGVIGLRSVSVGAYVTPGQAIVELAAVDPLKLEFRVPELALPSLRQGQPLRVTVDALPGHSFEGTIYAIDPIVDPGGRAIRMRARIPNPSGQLSPGLFARVELIVGRRDDAILVPESAVFARGREHFVFRVVDRHARLTKVELGARRPGLVEVRRGLDADDIVVRSGHQQLQDGGRVEVLAPGSGV